MMTEWNTLCIYKTVFILQLKGKKKLNKENKYGLLPLSMFGCQKKSKYNLCSLWSLSQASWQVYIVDHHRVISIRGSGCCVLCDLL